MSSPYGHMKSANHTGENERVSAEMIEPQPPVFFPLSQVPLPAFHHPKLLWQSFLHPFPVQLLRVHVINNEETGHTAEDLQGEPSPIFHYQIIMQPN